MRRRPQAATLALRRWCWSLVPVGKSWRTRRPARHKPTVPDLPLCCVGVIFRRFLCQGAAFRFLLWLAERGAQAVSLLNQSESKDGLHEL